MRQSRKQSLFEVIISTALGYIVALATQILIFPCFNIQVKFSDQLWIGLIFTIVSLLRGYCVRRLFNYIQFKHSKAVKYRSAGI